MPSFATNATHTIDNAAITKPIGKGQLESRGFFEVIFPDSFSFFVITIIGVDGASRFWT